MGICSPHCRVTLPFPLHGSAGCADLCRLAPRATGRSFTKKHVYDRHYLNRLINTLIIDIFFFLLRSIMKSGIIVLHNECDGVQAWAYFRSPTARKFVSFVVCALESSRFTPNSFN